MKTRTMLSLVALLAGPASAQLFAPNAEGVERTARDVAAMVDALRNAFATGADLERRAGPHCRWCPLLDDCSEGAAAVAILSPG